ncbi:MAG: hypothetical protein IPP58_12125 [Holophagaceae bacterium]|uniref:Uncharacterized protein n=1 Tax=Candidatus Geothrix skivensis TaxID=2954439 RepID=A0A9D7SIM3_9BACT|nr:hypothetical protein [Candidatus Geothrix skivensis]
MADAVLLRGAKRQGRYGGPAGFLLLMVAAPVATCCSAARALGRLRPVCRSWRRSPASARTGRSAAPDPAGESLAGPLPWLFAGLGGGRADPIHPLPGQLSAVQSLPPSQRRARAAEWHSGAVPPLPGAEALRTVRLLESAAVEVPTALGWLRPADPAARLRPHGPGAPAAEAILATSWPTSAGATSW